MFTKEVCADLVVKDADHSSFSVFTGEFNIHFTFSSFWVMSYTCRCYLILLKIDWYPLFYVEVLKVFCYVLMSFFLAQFATLSIQIVGFWAIFREKAVQYLFGNLKILAIRFYELFQKLLCRCSIFILKLRIYFEATLKEPIIALLKILRQGMI